jgi:hypothetical protein
MTTARTWIDRFAEAIGAPPLLDDEIDALLGLAGVAAHASERTAAPVATWLAGRAGLSPAEAKAAAERLAAELDAEA